MCRCWFSFIRFYLINLRVKGNQNHFGHNNTESVWIIQEGTMVHSQTEKRIIYQLSDWFIYATLCLILCDWVSTIVLLFITGIVYGYPVVKYKLCILAKYSCILPSSTKTLV